MPDYKTACEISRILLDERLIACANTLPNVTSMFLLDGAINTGSECITIMKTLGHLYAKLTQKIQELHPYNIPAIFSIPMQDCNQAFLDWIVDSLPPG